MLAPVCCETPDWLRVSLVGCVWGGLTLAGLACSWSQRRLLSGLYALCLAGLAHRSLGVLTDLQHNASWVVVISSLAAGWAIGSMLTPWSSDVRMPRAFSEEGQPATCRQKRLSRWSMWDICGLATAVAALCWSVPRVENQFELLCRFVPAALGGVLVSLIAVEWGWRDRWSLGRLGMLTVWAAAAGVLCLWTAPDELTPGQLASWALAGPAGAMSAQGLTVLAYIAARRIDTHLSADPTKIPATANSNA